MCPFALRSLNQFACYAALTRKIKVSVAELHEDAVRDLANALGLGVGVAVDVGVGVLPIIIWTTPCCAPIGFLCADLERTIYAQEKPNEAERDAGLQFIWFNKSTPPKMWQLYT